MREQREGLMLRWILIAIMLWSIPAHADWQYTRWGMTANQVVEASKGRALEIPSDRQRYRGGVTLLESSYSASGIDFRTIFTFDNSQKLHSIILEPKSFNDCGKIQTLVLSNYGPAIHQDRSGSMMHYQWVDREKSNFIRFSWDDRISICVFSYERLGSGL